MTLILAFEDYYAQAEKLANCLSLPIKQVNIHQFPDGETKVTLPETLPEKVIMCRSLNNPNEKLIELIITATAARNQGVTHITLIAPYLCYMRQDIAFNKGEAVSQKIIGQMLSDYFDGVITVDPHLHRIKSLTEAIPNTQAITLHASQAISAFLQKKFKQPIILGPDEESEQWAKAIAAPHQWQYNIATKQRFSDTEVDVSFTNNKGVASKQLDLAAQDIVIVDDIASTGKTLVQAVIELKKQKPKSISVIVTHAFFVDSAIVELTTLGVNNIWSSDSIPHPTNAFSIIDTIAQQIKANTD